MVTFALLCVFLFVYSKVSEVNWNQARGVLWSDLQTPLMIAGAVVFGVPLAVTGVWAAVLDSPQAVENGAERRWIVMTSGWAAWSLAALLAAILCAPAGLMVGVGLWAVLVTRRGCAKRQKPVAIRDGCAAVGRLIRRWWIVAVVLTVALVTAWVVVDREATAHNDEVRLWTGVAVVVISITTAVMIRRDVRRTADLRAVKPVIARHVLGIPDGRLGDLGWKVRGGPRPRLEMGFKGVGAPVRGTGLLEEVLAEVDRRLAAHAPSLECKSLTDVGITLIGVTPDSQARRMLAEQTRGMVVAVESVDQTEPAAIVATNEGDER